MDIVNNIDNVIKSIYKIKYPDKEIYGIQSQIRRSIISVSLNIIEGNAKNSIKEYLNYCYHAKGSLHETKKCIEISKYLNYVNKNEAENIKKELIVIEKQLNKLIQYLKSKI